MNFIDTLLSPFQFGFMINALAMTALVAVPCALLSCFLVLKGWALMGDAMSHAVFPGVVVAWMVGLPLGIGAFVAGLFCALATGFLQDNSRIKRDTVMGIVFSGMFGAGLVLYVYLKPDIHLDHILFGDMLGVGQADMIQTGIIALFTAGIIALKWKDFLLHAFDPTQAQASGLNVTLLHYRPAMHGVIDHRGRPESGGDYPGDFPADCSRCHRRPADPHIFIDDAGRAGRGD